MLSDTQHSQTSQSNLMAAFSMTKQAQELAEAHTSRKNLLAALSDSGCFSDAIMLLSFSLNDLNAIQWALDIIKTNSALIDNNDLISAIENWLVNPDELTREKFLPQSIVEQPNATCWLAMAAYWSGGGISDNAIIELAPTGLVNESIYSAVMLCIQELNIDEQDTAFIEAINQGITQLDA